MKLFRNLIIASLALSSSIVLANDNPLSSHSEHEEKHTFRKCVATAAAIAVGSIVAPVVASIANARIAGVGARTALAIGVSSGTLAGLSTGIAISGSPSLSALASSLTAAITGIGAGLSGIVAAVTIQRSAVDKSFRLAKVKHQHRNIATAAVMLTGALCLTAGATIALVTGGTIPVVVTAALANGVAASTITNAFILTVAGHILR